MEPGDRRRCTAHRTTDGEPCTRWARKGTTVCPKHGGNAPQVVRAGQLRVLEAELADELAQLDVAPVEDPFERLRLLAGQAVAWQERIATRVNALTELRYEASGAGTEQLRSEIALYERAMDRCAVVLGMIAKLNIDERLARISERQSDIVVRAVEAAIAASGLSGEAAAQAAAVAAREIRAAAA